jgi:hypothetical protein
MIEITTNVEELKRHLNKVFKGLYKSEELIDSGRIIYRELHSNFMENLESSTYDLQDTGSMKHYFSALKRNYEWDNAGSYFTVGFGNLVDMEDKFTNQELFRATRVSDFMFGYKRRLDKNGNPVYRPNFIKTTIEGEKQLPKWIIMEFGTGQYAEKGMPKMLKVNYTRRSGKQYLFGPSTREYSGNTKPTYIQVSKESIEKINQKHIGNNGQPIGRLAQLKVHRGVRPSRPFRNTLSQTKPTIIKEFSNGIGKYINRVGG